MIRNLSSTASHTQIEDLSPLGPDLTDDELSQVAGGERVVDVRSYDGGVYVDHTIYIFP